MYVHIPKCASIWAREYLANIGDSKSFKWRWEPRNFVTDDVDDFTPIIIMRDPIDRWISSGALGDKIFTIPKSQDQIRSLLHVFEKTFMHNIDEHDCPQSCFLQGLNLSPAVFFKCNDLLSVNFQDFLIKNNFDLATNLPGYMNVRPKTQKEIHRDLAWREFLSVQKHLDSFKIAYKADYSIINSATFYQI